MDLSLIAQGVGTPLAWGDGARTKAGQTQHLLQSTFGVAPNTEITALEKA